MRVNVSIRELEKATNAARKLQSDIYYLSQLSLPEKGDPCGPMGQLFHETKPTGSELLKEALGYIKSASNTINTLYQHKLRDLHRED